MAARSGKVKLLKKLWDWAKEMQLKPEGLMKEMLMSKDKAGQTAFLMATLNYLKPYGIGLKNCS